MKRLYVTVASVALAASLAACGKKPAEAPAETAAATATANTMASGAMATNTAAANTAAPAGNMASMDMSAGAMTGTGEGEVTAVDKTAGTITLKHGPIPGVKWPAMTMTFKANPPALVDQAKVGEKVSFDVKVQGSSKRENGRARRLPPRRRLGRRASPRAGSASGPPQHIWAVCALQPAAVCSRAMLSAGVGDPA